MGHSDVGHTFTLAVLAVTIGSLASAVAQTTPKKPSVWQQIKDAAKQGGQQGQPQQQPKQPGQNPGQQRQPAGQQTPARAQGGSQTHDSGPFTPPAGTKIEETVLAPLQDRASFAVSPHGVHVAAIETDGSRVVVYYDGVKGPKFDEILGPNHIAFSPDGNRYAYCGRAGNQYVVMVDGKELVRSAEANSGRFDGESCRVAFTSNSKHVFWSSNVILDTRRGQMFIRFWFDGQPSPTGSVKDGVVFSPDGDHFAYVLTISDPAQQDRFAFAVDGKIAPYVAGSPQWTNDSKHLYTQRTLGQNTELLFDGKPISRAFNFKVYIPPVGDLVVVAVTAGTNFHPFSFLVVNGKKVPGSDTVERGEISSVEFSPDGKHYAALCGDTNNHRYLIVDGKRAQEYVSIQNVAFTADSSTVVYQALMNGKQFIVVGDQEFGAAAGGLQPTVIAPVGNRVAAFIFVNGARSLLLDGKMTPLSARDGSDLSFTPDGAHYGYFAIDAGMGSRLVIDGVPQPQVALSNDIIDSQKPTALKYIFSADSKHVAYFGYPPTPGGDHERGVVVDGRYLAISSEGTNSDLAFSPDSKHLFCVHHYADQPLRLFIDGKPLLDFFSAGTVPNWFDFGSDGKLLLLAKDENSIKRITITLPETSLATMPGGGTMLGNAR